MGRVVPCLVALVALAVAPRAAVAVAAVPIPDPLPTTLPHYQGAPAAAQPMRASVAPRNPHLAPDPRSNIHNDTWMTDAYRRRPGPLGVNPVAFSSLMPPAVCGSLAFHSRGYLVSVCPSIGAPPQARVIDPQTLDVLATYNLPGRPDPPGTKQYQNFAGGGYFFLDGRDRIWSATKTSHVFVLQVSPDGRSITKVGDYDLTGVLADDERITSALPDFKGRIWFVSKQRGKVGILNPRTRRVRAITLNEDVQNSFTVGRRAVYIVSSARMYRFSARRGRPHVDWRHRYPNSGAVKPGQADAGSGTTPTIMRGGHVAITDNADPMHVVVYRTAKRARRVKCRVPVFETGASATENSLIASRRSLFVENNHGYQDPFGPNSGALSTPGFARIDVTRRGCRKAWESRTERAPSVVSKLSTRTGLIYTYTRDPAPPLQQPYFWTAIDTRTGATAFKVYAGSGLGFNNNYAGLALGPDGTAYLGVTSGIVALRDRP